VALARVSSREQEREGFSLDVQVEAFERWVDQRDGDIVKLFRIAETASKKSERKTFKELLTYVKANTKKIDALLFYKVDRAARNLFDYVELERLEIDHGVPVIYITQPTEDTPAGRMMRRMLANMASFYTEQMTIDIREGIKRRVESGLFPSVAPYGYRNVRVNGRGLVDVDTRKAANVRRIFDLYAHHGHTLDSLIDQLEKEAVCYTDSKQRFPRTTIHRILTDRAYLGEIQYRGQWHPGTHEPLIDLATFKRVQTLLRGMTYRAHELVFGSGMIQCAHCGSAICGERKTKQTQNGPKDYVYYFCPKAKRDKSHPKTRVTETQIDQQIIEMFRQIRFDDEPIRDWFRQVLQAKSKDQHQQTKTQLSELNRQLTNLRNQQEQLLNLRLLQEIEDDTFKSKNAQLRERMDQVKLQIDVTDRSQSEKSEIAAKVFELSQTLETQWLDGDYQAKRQILEITCSNFTLDGITLCYKMRKPFDVLAKGLCLKNGGESGIRTHGGPESTLVFETSTFNRSVISPAVCCSESYIV
tara:strand:+ start:7384 stop:8967 length:1584 start_codon:yes stop_codon:yes gene_type:complete